MSLNAGTRLGPYEIVAPIGAGGMGEVYKARDTRLERTVAIKILPAHLSASPELKQRFEREAKTISSFQHPHICTLFDIGHQDGIDFLVMECLEGETLADRLRRGALPLAELIRTGVEIADALEKAHRAGIVHRDLKPANIMLTKSGAKLLDFGLAKPAAMGAAAGAHPSNTGQGGAPLVSAAVTMDGPSPQLSPLTTHGSIVGTVQYMSPQQIEGKEIDARSDIFSFGAVLYEMATGTCAFQGKSQLSVASAILEKEPEPITTLQPSCPPALQHVVSTCLAKDPEERYQSALDVKLELQWVANAPTLATAARVGHPKGHPAWIAVAGVAVLVALISLWVGFRSPRTDAIPMHLAIALPPDVDAGPFSFPFAISPDGRWLLYSVAHENKTQIYIRGISDPEARLVNGTESDATAPFFSPDSRWIGFASGSVLKKVPIGGGSPVDICSISTLHGVGGFLGGEWGTDGRILFVPDFNGGIWSVSENGGVPQLVLKTDMDKGPVAYSHLQILPGNKGILFTSVPGHAIVSDDDDIAVLPAGATQPKVLIHGGGHARYLPTGHIVYGNGHSLLAVPFDLSRLEVTGAAVPVVSHVQQGIPESLYDVSGNGTLVYVAETKVEKARVAIVDRRGNMRAVSDGSVDPQEIAVSPDGRTVVARGAAVNDDLWAFDVQRGTSLRLTFDPGDEIFPQWLPDGKRIVYGSRFGRMFLRSADGSGTREEISRGDDVTYPSSVSPDGKWLLFVNSHPSRSRDIWLVPLTGDRKPTEFQVTAADECCAKFSPDGRWVAYSSNETGTEEVYVRPFGGSPGASGGRRRISAAGGRWPVWARSGRELFFQRGDKIMSVAMDAQADPVGEERVALDAAKIGTMRLSPQTNINVFDVMPDGEHFVLVLTPDYRPPTHYNVIVNWFEELKRLKK